MTSLVLIRMQQPAILKKTVSLFRCPLCNHALDLSFPKSSICSLNYHWFIEPFCFRVTFLIVNSYDYLFDLAGHPRQLRFIKRPIARISPSFFRMVLNFPGCYVKARDPRHPCYLTHRYIWYICTCESECNHLTAGIRNCLTDFSFRVSTIYTSNTYSHKTSFLGTIIK